MGMRERMRLSLSFRKGTEHYCRLDMRRELLTTRC